jgi:hypothetical protein
MLCAGLYDLINQIKKDFLVCEEIFFIMSSYWIFSNIFTAFRNLIISFSFSICCMLNWLTSWLIFKCWPVLHSPQNQWTNKEMDNWTKQNFFKRRNSNCQKTHEKMLTISGCKGNANQNHTKIPSHPC